MFASGSAMSPANAIVFKNMLVPENYENITVMKEIIADNVVREIVTRKGHEQYKVFGWMAMHGGLCYNSIHDLIHFEPVH